MKRSILTTLTLLPVLAFAQNGKFTVQGKLGNYNAPAKAYLQYRLDGKTQVDSAVLRDGKFEFTGTVSQPTTAYLLFNEKGTGMRTNDHRSIWLETGNIVVKSPDQLAHAQVTGTKTNEENERYQAALKPINDDYDALEAKEKAATQEQQNSPAYQRDIHLAEKTIEAKEAAINKKFIQDNPGSYISLNALEMFAYSADYKDIEPLYSNLSPALKETKNGKAFGERLPKLKAVALGATAPEFTEADTSGKMVSLSSFRGKYVLVDFWASWCGPCRRENPNVVKAYNQYKDKNFTIVGVSLDRPNAKEAWLKAIHNDGLNWTQVSDLQFWNSKTAALYGVRAIPQNFLLDPNGKIIGKNLRGDDLADKLAELLGKKLTAN